MKEKLTSEDKILFKGEVVAPDTNFLNAGEFLIEGKGVLKKKNDNPGDYSVKVKLSFIG